MMRRVLFLVVCFLVGKAWSIPLRPDVEEMLRRTGQLKRVIEIEKDMRKKGVNSPNPKKREWLRRKLTHAKEPWVQPSIVILVDFDDNEGTTPRSHFEELLFSVDTYPTGSMRDYYLENSYGLVDIQGEVTTWLRMPNDYTYYVAGQMGFGPYPRNAQKLVEDAVVAADPFVDFSQFDADNDGYVDALFVVHAGPGYEETGNSNHIWSHKWFTRTPVPVDGVYVYEYSMEPENGRIGVFCHELGHVFGLPDLYDYGYDSQGLGMWSVMAGGSWGNWGATPVHFDAWSKKALGFVVPEVIEENVRDFHFLPVEDTALVVLLWTNGNPSNQYFLAEERRKKKFDLYLPGEGLLIYHIDELKPGNDEQWYPPDHVDYGHYKVALEQADGRWDLEKNYGSGDEGDPFPGSTNNTSFGSWTWPDSRDYNFNLTFVNVKNIRAEGEEMFADLFVDTIPFDIVPRKFISPSKIVQAGDSVQIELEVANFGGWSANFDAQVEIESSGVVIYTAFQPVSGLGMDESEVIAFPPFFAGLSGTKYSLKAFVNCSGDSIRENDTLFYDCYSFDIVREVLLDTSSSSVSIDGEIDETEWADAVRIDISNVLREDSSVVPNSALMYFKSNGDTLFLALSLPSDSTNEGTDRWIIYFDDNGDGIFPEQGNDREGQISFQSGSSTRLFFRPLYETGTGSPKSIDFPHAVSFADSTKRLEIAIPLGSYLSAPSEFLGVSGRGIDTAGILVTYIDVEKGALGFWPQDVPPEEDKNPSLYSKLILKNVTVGTKEASHNDNSSYKPKLFVKRKGERVEISLIPGSAEFVGSLKLYDRSGRMVRKFFEGTARKSLRFVWNFKDERGKLIPRGIYFLRLEGNGYKVVKKIPVIY